MKKVANMSDPKVYDKAAKDPIKFWESVAEEVRGPVADGAGAPEARGLVQAPQATAAQGSGHGVGDGGAGVDGGVGGHVGGVPEREEAHGRQWWWWWWW